MPVPYVHLLADRRIRGLAAGNLASSVGDGMAVVLALARARARRALAVR